MPTLTEQKEAFFANLPGTTTPHVLLQLAVLPACALLLRTALPLCGRPRAASRLPLECLALLLPLVLAHTAPVWGIGGGLALCALAAALGLRCGAAVAEGDEEDCEGEGEGPDAARQAALPALAALSAARPAFVTHFRASIVLLTVVAILAVDFAAFPRALAKSESLGLSLMDAIVGAFAFSAGLSSAWARAWAGASSAGSADAPAPAPPSLLATLRKLALLGGLGALRLLTHAATAHHSHHSEYGVHWNFYFSLAALLAAGEALGSAGSALAAALRACSGGSGGSSSGSALGAPLRASALLLGALALSLGFERAVLAAPMAAACGALGLGPPCPAGPGAPPPPPGSLLPDPVCALPLGSGAFGRGSVAYWALCGPRAAWGSGGGNNTPGATLAALFMDNREGLLSLAGLLALYLIGASAGVLVAGAGLEARALQLARERALAAEAAAAAAAAAAGGGGGGPRPARAPPAPPASALAAAALAAQWQALLCTLAALAAALWLAYAALCAPSWQWASEMEGAAEMAALWPAARLAPGSAVGAGLGASGAFPPGFPVSRRLANAPYVLWCGALCVSLLAAWGGVEWASPRSAWGGSGGGGGGGAPGLLELFSAHNLVAFVVANLGVGLVNAAGDAVWGGCLHAPPWAAAAATCAYAGGVVAVVRQWHAAVGGKAGAAAQRGGA